jgi:hypothetical protein
MLLEMLTVTHNGKLYEVAMPQKEFALVDCYSNSGVLSQLLHPIDALRLGVHNGGYFHSGQSDSVHGEKQDLHGTLSTTLSTTRVLDKYFTKSQQLSLHQCYWQPKSELGHEHNNYFGISASSSLDEWLTNGWIDKSAPEGWFEKYTQFVMHGGAMNWQLELKRYNSFAARHSGQVRANCPGDMGKRKKQRQALLNWASPLAFT